MGGALGLGAGLGSGFLGGMGAFAHRRRALTSTGRSYNAFRGRPYGDYYPRVPPPPQVIHAPAPQPAQVQPYVPPVRHIHRGRL